MYNMYIVNCLSRSDMLDTRSYYQLSESTLLRCLSYISLSEHSTQIREFSYHPDQHFVGDIPHPVEMVE